MASLNASGLRQLAQGLSPASPRGAGPAEAPVAPVPLGARRDSLQLSQPSPSSSEGLVARARRRLHGDPTKPKPLSPWAHVKGKFKQPPVDSFLYRLKVAFLGVVCNIDLPFLRRKPFEQGAPAEVKAALQPGDILLRRTDWTSGNFFIPSWWKHAAVYTGDGQITEAAFKGLRTVTVDAFFEHGDDVMIIRKKDLTPRQREAMVAYAKAQVGKPYDFNMDFVDESRMSCTELAYQSLQAATGRDPVGMGTFGEVTGDRFMNPNFDLVWTSNPEASGVVD